MTDQDLSEETTLDVSLISLCDRTLILPSSALVETVALSMPQVVTKMPRWFLGFLPWQGLRLPFISFESMTDGPFKIDINSNIIVLKTTTLSLQNKFFAMLIQNIPMNCRIHNDSLLDVVGELSSYELATVRLDEMIAKIPNMSIVENTMIKAGVLG